MQSVTWTYGRVDWLTFVVRSDVHTADKLLERFYNPLISRYLDRPDSQRQTKIEVKRNKTTNQNYYLVHFWGQMADYVAYHIDMTQWPRLTRIDWRTDMPGVTSSDLDAWKNWQQANQPGRCKFTPINGKAAKKTNKRDWGGTGGSFGSSKSDEQMVAYKRGSEMPACEYRARDRKAKAIASAAQDYAIAANGVENGYTRLTQLLAEAAEARMVLFTDGMPFDKFIKSKAHELNSEAETVQAIRALATEASDPSGRFWAVMNAVMPGIQDAYTLVQNNKASNA